MNLSKEEIPEYLEKLYGCLMENRYKYYVLHDPIWDDDIYDWMEKYYNRLVQAHGGKEMIMVDFNPNDLDAIAAKERVDSGTDSYSLWEATMKPVWDRLGRNPKEEKKEKKEKAALP